MCVELRERGLSFANEKSIKVMYKGRVLHDAHIDLIVESKVVVEVKAVSQLEEGWDSANRALGILKSRLRVLRVCLCLLPALFKLLERLVAELLAGGGDLTLYVVKPPLELVVRHS